MTLEECHDQLNNRVPCDEGSYTNIVLANIVQELIGELRGINHRLDLLERGEIPKSAHPPQSVEDSVFQCDCCKNGWPTSEGKIVFTVCADCWPKLHPGKREVTEKGGEERTKFNPDAKEWWLLYYDGWNVTDVDPQSDGFIHVVPAALPQVVAQPKGGREWEKVLRDIMRESYLGSHDHCLRCGAINEIADHALEEVLASQPVPLPDSAREWPAWYMDIQISPYQQLAFRSPTHDPAGWESAGWTATTVREVMGASTGREAEEGDAAAQAQLSDPPTTKSASISSKLAPASRPRGAQTKE